MYLSIFRHIMEALKIVSKDLQFIEMLIKKYPAYQPCSWYWRTADESRDSFLQRQAYLANIDRKYRGVSEFVIDDRRLRYDVNVAVHVDRCSLAYSRNGTEIFSGEFSADEMYAKLENDIEYMYEHGDWPSSDNRHDVSHWNV